MNRPNAPSYEIARFSGRCAVTGAEFAPGERYIASLCEREGDSEGFDRFDFSMAAWESGHRPERLFSFWKTAAPEPNAERRLFIDDEALLNLFQRLEGDDQPQRIAYRFVLALILLRKRLLKHVGTRLEGDQSIWSMRMKGDPPEAPPIDVIDPKLTGDEAQQVSDQLSEALRGEW